MEPALVTLFRHHAWANDRLLGVCEPLGERELEFATAGTYGAIGQTLKHIVEAEERYVALLRGAGGPDAGGYGRPTPPEGLGPNVRVLRARAAISGAALIELAGTPAVDAVLSRPFRGEVQPVRALTVLTQALDHGAEHRTQVRIALTVVGIEPPELDGWTYDEEVLGPVTG